MEKQNLEAVESISDLFGHPKELVKSIKDYVVDVRVIAEPDSLTIEFGPREATEMGYRLIGPQEGTVSGHFTYVDGSKHNLSPNRLLLTDGVIEFPSMSAETYDIETVIKKIDLVLTKIGNPSYIRGTTRRDGPNWTPVFRIEYNDWDDAERPHNHLTSNLPKLMRMHRDFSRMPAETVE